MWALPLRFRHPRLWLPISLLAVDIVGGGGGGGVPCNTARDAKSPAIELLNACRESFIIISLSMSIESTHSTHEYLISKPVSIHNR